MKLQGALANQQQLGQNMASLEAQKAGVIPGAVGNIMGFLPSLMEEKKNGGRVRYAEGGQVPLELLQQIMAENKGGGQPVVQKTEGEENHGTNKKAIVDEETGEKEAEATGGEYIINSEQGDAIKGQYEAIAQMIQEGAEPSLEELQSLYDAVHEVFSQPQFNEA